VHGRFEYQPPIRLEDFRHLARRIIQISEKPGFPGTNGDASWKFAAFDPVVAPGALVGDLLLWIDETGSVRTVLDTIPAPETTLRINQNKPLRGPKSSSHRTPFHTRGFPAMVTKLGDKPSVLACLADFFRNFPETKFAAFWGIYIYPFIGANIAFHPRPKKSCRHVVFCTAGAYTVAAPDALADVHDKSKPPFLL